MTMLRARAALYELSVRQRRALLDSPAATGLFGAAGMTAALLPGWLSGQAPQARAWTALLPHMRSASMFTQIARGSAATVADQAAVFGACLALRSAGATLVQFGTGHGPLPSSPGQSPTGLLRRFGEMGDGSAAAAVRACLDRHDRIVIVTDEPHGSAWQGEHPAAAAPAGVPVYIWNVAGTPQPAAPSRALIQGRHVFAGLSDAAFAVIPLIEAASRDSRPF